MGSVSTADDGLFTAFGCYGRVRNLGDGWHALLHSYHSLDLILSDLISSELSGYEATRFAVAATNQSAAGRAEMRLDDIGDKNAP